MTPSVCRVTNGIPQKMRVHFCIAIFSCLAAATNLPFGLLPEMMMLVLHNLDYSTLGRLHQVSTQFHQLLSRINVDWLSPRSLNLVERGKLIKAIKSDDLQAAKRLLGNGPCMLNFDYGPDLGCRSVLMDVTKYGSRDLLHLLVKHGLRLTDYRYLYAVENCMACKKLDQMKYLFDNRDDLDVINGAERILCQACADSCRSLPADAIRWLLEHYEAVRGWVNCQRYEQPIHVARNLEIIRLLIEYGAEPNAQRLGDLRTKLHIVMLESVIGRPHKIRCLLDAGADATIQDKDGYTPLQLLLKNVPDVESVEILTSESGPTESGSSQPDQNKGRQDSSVYR